jgi:transposase
MIGLDLAKWVFQVHGEDAQGRVVVQKRQHTQQMNSVRGQLAEFGIVAAQGRAGLAKLVTVITAQEAAVPHLLLETLHWLVQQIDRLDIAIRCIGKPIVEAKRAKVGR